MMAKETTRPPVIDTRRKTSETSSPLPAKLKLLSDLGFGVEECTGENPGSISLDPASSRNDLHDRIFTRGEFAAN